MAESLRRTRLITEAATVVGLAIVLVAGAYWFSQVGAASGAVFTAFGALLAGAGNGTGGGGPEAQPLHMYVIEVPLCDGCVDFSNAPSVINATLGMAVASESLDVSNASAQALVSQYGITKLPAFVVTGDASALSTLATTYNSPLRRGAFVFEPADAPYFSVAENREVGQVSLILLNDSTCAQCYNVSAVPEILTRQGIKVANVLEADYNSPLGANISENYGLAQVPAVLVDGEINYYSLADSVRQVSAMMPDGSYLLKVIAPYRNLSTGKVEGVVDAVFLNDSSCADCYNVSLHEEAIRSFGMRVDSRTNVDVSSAEGRALVAKYNITAVPAILFSPEASAYYSLMQVWPSVGTVEPDGWLVFRDPTTVGVYKNLTSGEIVRPQAG
ncbi:MAG: hypothetical protein PHF51_03855 [Candidatus ainarchaeum sp.]|nr:hypothetical protein [Candidatus ainarchaeum sp.]